MEGHVTAMSHLDQEGGNYDDSFQQQRRVSYLQDTHSHGARISVKPKGFIFYINYTLPIVLNIQEYSKR